MCQVNKFQYRKSLTQFKISAHQLAIERGKYKKINKDKRFCGQCKNMQVEYEFHILIDNTAYEKQRDVILEEASILCENFPYISEYEFFIWLM